jgi:UDP-glucose:(heptosyl)LPS alpha-1,3-glucosyltransferase
LRIVQLTRSLSPSGGISNVAFHLAREFRRRGVPVVNCAWFPRETPENPDLGTRRTSILAGLCARIPGRHLRLLVEVPLFTLWATLQARRRREDVRIAHGDSLIADVFVAHSCHRAAVRVKRRSGSLAWVLNPLHAFLLIRERLVFGRRRPYLAAISGSVAREYREHYRFPEERIVLIPNGVDLERFRPVPNRSSLRERLGLPAESYIVLFVGHEFARKGLRFAIEGIARARSERPTLLVVGRDRAAPYRGLARSLRIEKQVRFLGGREDVPDIYAASDCFFLLSDYEPFGLVGLEALASGLPVIATRCGGVEQYLVDGVNGLYVERDGESVARALRRMLDEPSLHAGLAAGARPAAEAFGWGPIADKYLALAARAVEEKKP